ncbi:MAG: relaxase/mobilization nuclease domain-containing protein [Cyanobacteria bacterium J06636_16]
MIGKQVKGKSFRGVLNYLHQKEQATLIGGNMVGKTPRSLAAEFSVSRDLNPRLQKAVYHASLSLPKTERLDEDRWCNIADDYVSGMGFGESQYVVYRHGDRDHDHIHIVASRIRMTDGSTVSDSWDYRRSETLIRSLEVQYELSTVPSSRDRDNRAPTTGELRQQWRTGESGVRGQLVADIEQATEGNLTFPQFLHRLKNRGVNARVGYTRTGKVKGISYELAGVAFSGSKLGKAYTFPGLQKYRGVAYDEAMNSDILAANQRAPATAEQQKEQQRRTQIAAPILADFLSSLGRSEFEGRHYRMRGSKSNVELVRLSDSEILMEATWNAEQQSWEQREPTWFSEHDLDILKQLAQRLQAIRQQQESGLTQQRQRRTPELEL